MADTERDIRRLEDTEANLTSVCIERQNGYANDTYRIMHKFTGGTDKYYSCDSGDREQTGKITITKTTTQLTLNYDGANTCTFTTSSAGDLTIVPSGGTVYIGTAGADDLQCAHLGIGTAPSATAGVNVSITSTDAASSNYGMVGVVDWQPSGVSTKSLWGLYFNAQLSSTENVYDLTGAEGRVTINGGSGTIRHIYGLRTRGVPTSTTRTATGNYYSIQTAVSGTGSAIAVAGNGYGLLLGDYTPWFTIAGTKYGIYQAGSTLLNVFEGHVTIPADNIAFKVGTTGTASFYHNGTNAILDPDEVGSGILLVGTTGENNLQCGQLGVGGAPLAGYAIRNVNSTVTSAISEFSIYGNLVRTGGATDQSDGLYGMNFDIIMNNNGQTIGTLAGIQSFARMYDGIIGTGGSNKHLYSFYGIADLDAGTINGNMYGLRMVLDKEAGTTVTGDCYVCNLQGDFDGATTGDNYMLYFLEQSSVDYGLYQLGTAPSVFGGPLSGSANGIVCIRADSNSRCLCLEENSGGEQWQIGVNADGALVFEDSTTTSILIADGGNLATIAAATSAGWQANRAETITSIDTDEALGYTSYGGGTFGSTIYTGAQVIAYADEDWNNAPPSAGSRIEFKTATNASIALTTRLKINNAGHIYIEGGSLYVKERAAADTDVAAYGQLWVKNTTPCELWFTDDAGTDTQIV